MKLSELMLQVKAQRGTTTLDFDPVKLADGVIATSTLVEKHGMPVMMKDKFVRIIPETGIADINYVINRADLQPKELKAAFQERLNLQRQLRNRIGGTEGIHGTNTPKD